MSEQQVSQDAESWLKNREDARRFREMTCMQIVFMAGIAANIDRALNGDDQVYIDELDILREITNKLSNPKEVVE